VHSLLNTYLNVCNHWGWKKKKLLLRMPFTGVGGSSIQTIGVH
jgi:hypothetical protein